MRQRQWTLYKLFSNFPCAELFYGDDHLRSSTNSIVCIFKIIHLSANTYDLKSNVNICNMFPYMSYLQKHLILFETLEVVTWHTDFRILETT